MSLVKNSSNFRVFLYGRECQYRLSPFKPVRWAGLSASFTPIKVPLKEPFLSSHCVSVKAEGEHPRPRPEVWGYRPEISHWRKVNMVGVMRLEQS